MNKAHSNRQRPSAPYPPIFFISATTHILKQRRFVTETNAAKIARFNPEDKTFKEYDIPIFLSRLQKEGAQIWGMKFQPL